MIAIFMSGAIALVASLVSTRFLIRFFRGLGKGQPILTKDENNAVVAEHSHKHGTPTMGGIAIVLSATIGYVVTHARRGVVFSDVWEVVGEGGRLGREGVTWDPRNPYLSDTAWPNRRLDYLLVSWPRPKPGAVSMARRT